MDFLKKAKAKQKELSAQIDNLTKGTSGLGFGDKKDTTAASAPEPVAVDRSGEWKEVSTGTPSNTSTPATTIATPVSSVPMTPATATSPPTRPEKPKAKLSLAQRKNFRDEYESRKPEYEERITKSLGVPWTVEIDIAAVMNNKGDGTPASVDPGPMSNSYVDSAATELQKFAEKFATQGVSELNQLAYHHILVVDLDYKKAKDYTDSEKNRNRHYCRGEISDGFLFLYINPENLWTSADYAFSRFEDFVLEARVKDPSLAGTIDFECVASIETEWEPEAESLLSKTQTLFNNKSLTFDPNWQEVWKPLDDLYRNDPKQKKLDWGWRQQFAAGINRYYDAFYRNAEERGFGGDDMLQEAFNEAVPKNIIKFVLVPKVDSGYSQLKFVDGVLELQTTVDNWRTNEGHMGDKILDLL